MAQQHQHTYLSQHCKRLYIPLSLILELLKIQSVSEQFLSCALVQGRGTAFRHYYKSIAQCVGKDFRDGAVVPFE